MSLQFHCLRYSTIICMFFFWICGPVLMCVGTYYAVNPSMRAFADVLSPGDITLIRLCHIVVIMGAIILLLGIIGVFGVFKGQRIALGVYVAAILIILLTLFGTGIFFIGKKQSMQYQLDNTLILAIHAEYPAPPTENNFKTAMDNAQFKLWGCCGANSSEDWLKSDWYEKFGKKENLRTPPSCCISAKYPDISLKGDKVTSEYRDCQKSNTINSQGCAEVAGKWIQSQLPLMIGFTIAVTLIGIASMVTANFFCISLSKAEYKEI